MPYQIDWLDEDRAIVAVRLYDPLPPEEISSIQAELVAIVEQARPLYVLADIREFNAIQGLSGLTAMLDSTSLPSVSEDQMRRSRVAIIGGGALIKMVLGMTQGALDDSDLIRAFDHEDQAYSWLLECADNRSPFSSPGQ